MYKIYRIVDNTNGNVYIGQTKQKYLSNRITKHRFTFKNNKDNCSSKLILCNNDWFYELIEQTDDKTREIYWIQNTSNCINQIKYTYDYKQSKEYKMEYRIKNKNKIKQNYQKNKHKYYEQTKEYRKKYKENNKKENNFHQQNRRHYKKTWGGDERYHNNLLNIDVNLFI